MTKSFRKDDSGKDEKPFVIKSHKIQIYPNKEQKKLIKRILRACNVMYREVTDRAFLSCVKEYITALQGEGEFPKNYAEKYLAYTNEVISDPKFAGLFDNITKHTLTKVSRAALESLDEYMTNTEYDYENFSYIKNTHSFYTDPSESKKWVTKKYVKMPMLKKVRACDTNYLREHTPKELVGLTVMKDGKNYFLTVRIREPMKPIGSRKKADLIDPSYGISIELSTTSKFAYIGYRLLSQTSVISGFMDDPRIDKYEQHIRLLESSIDNLKLKYNSCKRIDYLNTRINGYKKLITNIKMNAIDRMVRKIIRKNRPLYIVMGSFSVDFYKNSEPDNEEYQKLIDDRMWWYFLYRLKSAARFHLIDLIVPERYSMYNAMCSECKMIMLDQMYSGNALECTRCGHVELRASNTAKNLADIKYGKSLFYDKLATQ